MVDEAEIEQLIGEAAAHLTVERRPLNPTPSRRVARLDHRRARNAREFAELTRSLQELDAAQLFDDRMQCFAGQKTRRSVGQLAEWLTRRARQEDPATALADMKRYAASENFPAIQVMALAGVKTDEAHAFSDDIQLIPFDELPESAVKRKLGFPFSVRKSDNPSTALVRRLEHPVRHEEPGSGGISDELAEINRAPELRDARLCLSVGGPCGPVRSANWVEAPDSVPMLGRTLGSISHSRPLGVEVRQSYEIDNSDVAVAADFYSDFTAASPSTQDWIRVALERLISSMQRYSEVEAAIDLGIATETIFLHDIDDPGELSFRIRNRAARLLGSDKQERLKIYRLFTDVYALRSTAVHEGRVPDEKRGRKPRSVLSDGSEYLAQAIRKVVRENIDSPQDWQAVTLG